MDLVHGCTSSLTPVKGRFKLIKTNQRPKDVDEVQCQLRVLVRDRAKKLQATNNRLHAEQAEHPIDAEGCDVQSKCSRPFTVCDSPISTHSFFSGPIRLSLSALPKTDQDPHYLTKGRNESQAPFLALHLV